MTSSTSETFTHGCVFFSDRLLDKMQYQQSVLLQKMNFEQRMFRITRVKTDNNPILKFCRVLHVALKCLPAKSTTEFQPFECL